MKSYFFIVFIFISKGCYHQLVGHLGNFIALGICLLFSAFFSMTETTITSINRSRLKTLSEENYGQRKNLSWLMNNVPLAVNITLIGNNLVNISSSALATKIAIDILQSPVAVPVAVAIMTVFIVIFCEILPKNLGMAYQEKCLLLCLPLLRIIGWLLTPITWFLGLLLALTSKVFGLKLDNVDAFATREEIDYIVEESSAGGELEEKERQMIHGVIGLEDTRISEVMEPRNDMSTIEVSKSIDDAITIFTESGHSRIPVYNDDIDHIVGILYAKDLLKPLSSAKNFTIKSIMRQALFVPETMKTDEALDLMKKSHKHIAIVVDEYGGTAGLVSLEDLIEEIVGDIQDEYDEEVPDIAKTNNGAYVVQGFVNLEDLGEELKHPFNEDFPEVDTVAGMILELAGNFPKEGQVFKTGDWKIETQKVENHRIAQVLITYVGADEKKNSEEIKTPGGNDAE